MRRRPNHGIAVTLGLLLLGCPVMAVPSTAQARVGSVLDLTPGGVVTSSTPAVAIGADGETIVAWSATEGIHDRIVVRSGPAPDRLGPAHTISTDTDDVLPGTDVIAAVGPDGTAAVAWAAPGPPHNTRILVSTARAGRSFGAARVIDGSDAVQSFNGVAVDGANRIVVSWDDDGPGCCGTGIDRYVVGTAGGGFSAPRTLPVTHQDGGDGQVLETAEGSIVITGADDQLFELNRAGDSLTELARPPGEDINGGAVRFATGPVGIVASLYSDAAGADLDPDIGTTVLTSGAAWRTPTFVPLPGSFSLSFDPGDYPAAALGAGGSVSLVGSFGNRLVLSRAGAGGTLGPFVRIGHGDYDADVAPLADPQIVAFGTDIAVTSVTRPQSGLRSTLHLTTARGSAAPVGQTLGSGLLTSPVLVSNAHAAIVAWAGNRHVWLWYADG